MTYQKKTRKLIIGHKEYTLSEKRLLCQVTSGEFFDKKCKTVEIYYFGEDEFLLLIREGAVFNVEETASIINRKNALQYMDTYPGGIKEAVYKQYFGEPEKA